MNDQLKKLLDLQEIDLRIEKIRKELEQIPVAVEVNKGRITQLQGSLEASKQKLTQIQLSRKNKELDVASQDEKIAKHEKELNSLKSNEAYKALLGEIETAKRKKSEYEDEILNLMVEFDKSAKELKEQEVQTRGGREAIEGEIRVLEERALRLKADMDTELAKREAFVPNVQADLLSRYDFIRTKKKSNAIASIAGESCSGCNTNLTQNILNEVRKGKELVICESCARILYHPASQTETAPA